ncbi:hypothetical protein MTP09_06295 [Chryseobacterium suipulveris]|uniref:Uncharacterized protein n=1 Tax=Chryseobacterium suipulveris TaxID=2929800 RepID=A0ABY4BST2_9FLAO|nr:hypothetical protein [Chryseobacterium suipulveris]UOE42246.1 hypothetical protein MTP09_06295 [Chryseobacterium suipulveris]
MESIVKNEFIFYLNVIFGIITANGKSIGEVRAKNERLFNFRTSGADIFSMKLNYKNNVEWKNSGG